MNSKKTHKISRFSIFLLCFVSFLIFPLFVKAANYPITWTPAKVEHTIARGDSRDELIEFSSSKELQNVDLWIVEDLQPYMSIEPNHFDSIPKNTPVNVTLHISASSDIPVGSYDGTIHLKVGSRTYSATLKVKLNIVDFVQNISPGGGVVEITTPNNELYGTKIVIPAEALVTTTPISITLVGIPADLPEDTANGGIFVEVGPDGAKFNSNIQVNLPYDDRDNDGILDYSEVPEDNLFVMTWDGQQWVNVPIIAQDKTKNTVTFETNHFSIFTTVFGCTGDSTNAYIFSIDGLSFQKTFLTPFWFAPTGYLRDGLLELSQMGLGFGKCDVYTFPWSRNAWETQSIIPSLVSKMEDKFKKEAIDKKKKFIIASHSWGTQLATLALQYRGLFTSFEVKPDLFLTLSNPEGSNLVDPAEYTNTRFCPSCGVSISYPVFSLYPPFYEWITVTPELTVDMAEALVNGFVSYQHALTETALFLNPLYLHHDLNYERWINYWDVGDLISGPLDTDNKTVRNDTERDFQNMKEVHAITSLCCESKRDSNWQSHDVIDEGKSFRNTVCDDIADVIGGTCDHGLICAGPEGPFCPWPTAQPPCGPTPNTCSSLRTVDGSCFCHKFISCNDSRVHSCAANADCDPGWKCSNSCCGSNLCHPPCEAVGGVAASVAASVAVETKSVPMSSGNSD